MFFYDIYLGESLNTYYQTLNPFFGFFLDKILLFLLVIIFIFFIVMIYVYLKKINTNPNVLFKRYLYLKEEMKKVDNLYINKKIDFEDYTFAQFHFAKEYEQIILILKNFPEYKDKLQNYTLATLKYRENEEEQEDLKAKKEIKTIHYMSDLLLPHTKYYTIKEIKKTLIEENFSKDVAERVVDDLKERGAVFNSSFEKSKDKAPLFVNNVFDNYKQDKKSQLKYINIDEEVNKQKTPISKVKVIDNIKIKEPIEEPVKVKVVAQEDKSKEMFDNISEDYKNKPIFKRSEDESAYHESIKNLFKKDNNLFNKSEDVSDFRKSILAKDIKSESIFTKLLGIFGIQKKYSISEINDIFKDIDNHLKK